MQFDTADMDIILGTTGEDITIAEAGASKVIRAKFRKNFQSVSPYEANVGVLLPSFICKTSDLVGVTSACTVTVQGITYKYDGKPEELPSGFTNVRLGLKK